MNVKMGHTVANSYATILKDHLSVPATMDST